MKIEMTLLPGLEQYADDIKLFVDAMQYKLFKNKHKGHWRDKYKIPSATDKLEDEVGELRVALRSDNAFHIVEECADVANQAMILASVVMRKYALPNSRKESPCPTQTTPIPDLPPNSGR